MSLSPPPDPLRVLHVITSTEVGGAERLLLRTLRTFAARTRAPRIVARTVCVKPLGPVGDQILREGFPVASAGAPPPRGLRDLPAWAAREAGTVRLILREVRSFRPHVLHTWLQRAAILGRLAGHFSAVPVIASIHVIEREKLWQVRLDGATSGMVARYFAVSRSVARWHAERSGIDPGRIEVIVNGIERQDLAPPPGARSFRARHGIPSGAFLACAVGRLHRQKGQETLLEAAARLGGSPAFHLAIVGTGPEEGALRARAAALPLGGRVHFLGHLDDPREAMAASDVFCLPSLWEGMPLVLLEAMGQGIACVASDIAEIAEVARPGKEALLVAPGDPGALARALALVRDDGVLRHDLALAGRARVLAEFTMERNCEALAALYARVASGGEG